MAESKLIRKWEAACRDLGLEIVVPYEVDVGNNTRVRADFLVRNFGASNGTLVFTNVDTIWQHRKALPDLGYAYSVLDEPTDEANERYDRDLFIDMLSEWEWAGNEGDKPVWLKSPPEDEDS